MKRGTCSASLRIAPTKSRNRLLEEAKMSNRQFLAFTMPISVIGAAVLLFVVLFL
jgi:hypothetical protein